METPFGKSTHSIGFTNEISEVSPVIHADRTALRVYSAAIHSLTTLSWL